MKNDFERLDVSLLLSLVGSAGFAETCFLYQGHQQGCSTPSNTTIRPDMENKKLRPWKCSKLYPTTVQRHGGKRKMVVAAKEVVLKELVKFLRNRATRISLRLKEGGGDRGGGRAVVTEAEGG